MGTLADSLGTAVGLVMAGDPSLWQVVGLSLAVSGTACLLASGFGLLAGTALAVLEFPGRRLLVWLTNTLLALPSVVVGLLVYLLLSRSGPLGSWGILFTPTAMVIAQTVLVLPIVTALARQLVADAAKGNAEQLRSLGARPWGVGLLLLLHERHSLGTVFLTAFGRAVAEVGAVMVVGGNIEGLTRVMTTAIALETSKGDLPLALGLGAVLLGVVGLLNLSIQGLQHWQGRWGGRA